MAESKEKSQSATLYVGDLDPAVSESDLVAAFEDYGFAPVSSARVCRDRATGSSLRYAYVNFPDSALAAAAISRRNHSWLKGRPMRIMWSVRDPISRKNGIGNLFVKNLEEWIGGSELEKLFQEYGTVLSCKVSRDENGKSREFGFVQMANEESAKAAMAALHGKVLDRGTKELYVTNFVKKVHRQPSAEEHNNLYIKNLERYITDDSLRVMFSEFGKVSSAAVMKDELGKSRGFGFVSFQSLEQAKKAMETLNGSTLGSRVIYVGFAQKKVTRSELLKLQFSEKLGENYQKKSMSSNVFVKYLSHSVDDKALLKYFSQCGKVVSTKVIQKDNGLSKGFGFVCFSSPFEAKEAVATLHGTIFHGRQIYVAIAQRKEDRQKGLQDYSAKTLAQPQPTYYGCPSAYPHYYHIPYQGYRYFSPELIYHPQQFAANWPNNDTTSLVHKYYAPYSSTVSSSMQQSAHTVYPTYLQATKSGGSNGINHIYSASPNWMSFANGSKVMTHVYPAASHNWGSYLQLTKSDDGNKGINHVYPVASRKGVKNTSFTGKLLDSNAEEYKVKAAVDILKSLNVDCTNPATVN